MAKLTIRSSNGKVLKELEGVSPDDTVRSLKVRFSKYHPDRQRLYLLDGGMMMMMMMMI